MASRRHRFWASGLGLAMKSHAARSSVAASAPAATPLLTDLIAYWDLDETSGTRADSHTNGLDLTDNNTVGSGLGVDGVSTAADFELDNSEYLSRASESASQPSATSGFTVCGWARLEGYGFYGPVLAKDDVSSRTFVLMPNNSGDSLPAMHVNGDSIKALWGAQLNLDTWYFIVGWWDPADGKAYIQVNNGTPVASAGTGTVITDGTATITIGALGDGSTYKYDGRMQSVGYWNRVLTSDERTWLYNSGSAARTYAEVAAYTG